MALLFLCETRVSTAIVPMSLAKFGLLGYQGFGPTMRFGGTTWYYLAGATFLLC